MIRRYEKQNQQRTFQEQETLKKHNLSLHKMGDANAKETTLETLDKNEYLRNELQIALSENYSKSCKNNLRLCEESLGKNLGEIKLKINREEKMRQLLWNTSPELRELRKLMLTADVTRDQAMQIAQKQALAELRQQEAETLAAAVKEETEKYLQESKRKEELEFQARLKYHKDLDQLRRFKAANEDKDEEVQKRERDAINQIKKKIEEEDKEIARKKIETQRNLHQQTVELQRVRENMKLLEKQAEKNMDLKVDEYRKAHELRTKKLEEERQFNLDQKLQLQEELCCYLKNMYDEKIQQDVLWTELNIAEKEALEKEKVVATEKRQRILKEEMQKLYDMQMLVKKQKAELQKKEEILLRENLLAQLYEEEKLEHMSQQKRRLKQAEHRRIAQELIEQNRKKKEIEIARDKADIQLLKDREEERLKLVEEERRKFLSSHANELLGYLPKKMFRDKNEIECLGEEFKKFYLQNNFSSPH